MTDPEPIIPKAPPAEDRLGIRRRLARAFEEIRGADEAGCQAIIDHDDELAALVARWPGPDPEELWGRIIVRFQWLSARGPCLQCGTCCRTASPTLYEGDLAGVRDGWLPTSSLYTLRAGELAWSSRLREAAPVERDLVKIRETRKGRCAFLESSRCKIHGHHPLQCLHLECWSGKHAGELSSQPRLDRRLLYAGDETALALIEEYDAKVPAAELAAALAGAGTGDEAAAVRALELIDLDDRLREGIAARFGYDRHEQALLLGREALLVAGIHGLVVTVGSAGAPRLVKAAARADAEPGPET